MSYLILGSPWTSTIIKTVAMLKMRGGLSIDIGSVESQGKVRKFPDDFNMNMTAMPPPSLYRTEITRIDPQQLFQKRNGPYILTLSIDRDTVAEKYTFGASIRMLVLLY